MGVHRQSIGLTEWMRALQQRLRRVRVCCGDWARICTDGATAQGSSVGVFLDPPYSAAAGRDESIYRCEDDSVAHRVREWVVERGVDRRYRIALCGYEGEHTMPAEWECVPWKANGGYANFAVKDKGRVNAGRERIWFSPGCMRIERGRDLFEVGVEERA